MIAALRRSTLQGRGSRACVQMSYAAMSLGFHLPPAPQNEEDIERMVKDCTDRYGAYPYAPGTHFAASFGHLAGYSAAYYCYMWSEVISKDLFSRFEEHGLYNRKVADEYKNMILAEGGSVDAEEFVESFLGRPYSFDAFGKWLAEK